MADQNMIEKEFPGLEEKIGRLEGAQRELDSLEVPAKYQSQAASIKSKIKDPERVDQVEQELEELKRRIKSGDGPPPPGPKDFPPELESLYYDVSFVGEGGFARVHRARKKKDNAEVAVKTLKSRDAKLGKSFVTEMTQWPNLKHRNIVKLSDVNVNPVPFLEMELCDDNLDNLSKPVDIEQAAGLTFDLAEGLKYAHSKGIFHCDLTPANILFLNGVPKIVDWGLSKVARVSTSSTHSSFTLYYAAPEQISPKKFGNRDNRTDIYQLGAIFYELVTGQYPSDGDGPGEIMDNILSNQPNPPTQYKAEASEVEPIIMKCLEKDKDERYQSINELQKDLADYLKIEYQESLRNSSEIKRTNFLSGELCLLNLRTGDIAGALQYATDLKHYATGKTEDKLSELISGLEYRHKESMEIPEEVIEEAIIVVHQIRMER